jgi:glycerate kinase
MAKGLRAVRLGPIEEIPLSDGGDGLLAALGRDAPGRAWRSAVVTGPLGEDVRAEYLRLDGRSVIESARVCGLALVREARRDPTVATSFGVGELISAAGGAGLILGLGGSATVDGGAGMAQALGWRLLDGDGRAIPRGGAGLRALRAVLPPVERPRPREALALADVRNPLLGAEGAARVFGPQKGAGAAAVETLEEGLGRLAERIRADLGIDVRGLPRGGAAGGLGAGAVAFLGARLVEGSAWMLERARFDERLARARLVVTGEGAYDGQSGLGKIVGAVVARASEAGVPVVVVAGRTDAPARRGVHVLTGGGAVLDEAAIARLAARGAVESRGGADVPAAP